MPRRRLEGLRVLLTGASSGIGWHLALELAKRNARVIITARRNEKLSELAEQIRNLGGECLAVAGDVTAPETRKQLLVTAQTNWQGLDCVINNAGIGAMGRFDDADPERLKKIFEVNFYSVVELTREALPILREGRTPLIVNVGSVLGHRAAPLKSEYSASKFALHGFTDSLRAELVRDGIHVQLISPSSTDTEFFDSAIEDNTGKNWKKLGVMPPDKVARAIVRTMRTNRHEITLSFSGKMLVLLDRIWPWLADKVVGKFGQ